MSTFKLVFRVLFMGLLFTSLVYFVMLSVFMVHFLALRFWYTHITFSYHPYISLCSVCLSLCFCVILSSPVFCCVLIPVLFQ